jgi:hypothetical protein
MTMAPTLQKLSIEIFFKAMIISPRQARLHLIPPKLPEHSILPSEDYALKGFLSHVGFPLFIWGGDL